jgi:amidase
MSSENEQTPNKVSTSWLILVAEKQKQSQQKIPESWRLSPEHLSTFSRPGIDLIAADACRKFGILSELELDITEKFTATELVQRLASREISALDTTTAFCKRAAIAQQLVSNDLPKEKENWLPSANICCCRRPVSLKRFSRKHWHAPSS